MNDDFSRGLARLDSLAGIAKPLIAAVCVSSAIMAVSLLVFLEVELTILDKQFGEMILLDWLLIIDVVLQLLSMIAVVFWIYRAHANLRDAVLPGISVGPGWAVGWFAIPIANFFMPYPAMKELWQGSVEQSIDSTLTAPALLWVWWLSWIASAASSFSDGYSWIDAATYGTNAVSAGALFIIVSRITALQPSMILETVFE